MNQSSTSKNICLAVILVSLFVFGSRTFAEESDSIKLGISNYALPNKNEVLYSKSIEKIRELVKPKQLHVKLYSPSDLAEKAEEDRLDLVFGSSGFYRRTALRTGHKELLSIENKYYPNPNYTEGASIVVSSNRKELKTLEDLKNKTLSANAPFTFTGYLVPLAEFSSFEAEPEKFFKRQVFHGEGNTMKDVAKDVISGKADVGFLRLCMLETLEASGEIPQGSLKVIGEQTGPGEQCRRSTPLYPGWTVSSTPHASSDLIRKVSQGLLEMPPVGSNDLRWGIATNYQSVDGLYKKLKMGPYAYLRDWTIKGFIEKYWPFLLLTFIGVILLALYAFYLARLSQRRSKQLSKAFVSQRKLQQEKMETSEKMHTLQKVWAIGQLSSTFAHEVRQPLTTLQLLSRGLIRLKERDALTSETLATTLDNMNVQIQRMNQIVERVRDYARTPISRRVPLDLNVIVQKVIKVFSQTYPRVQFELQDNPCKVNGDPVEVDLVVRNLLRNAVEATKEVQAPTIFVRLTKEEERAILVIEDNGPKLTEVQMREIGRPLKTSKQQGLGLGLGIVRTIIESHTGSVSFSLNEPSGLRVTISLPLISRKSETAK